MKLQITTKLLATLAIGALSICYAQAQQGWAGYTQTGHYTTNNSDGTTTDHDSGKNENGDTISTETTRDPDGRAIFERTEVKGKDGKTKYIRMTKWGNRDKPWEITWGYLWDKQDDHPDYKYDPKTGEWMRLDTKLDTVEQEKFKTASSNGTYRAQGAMTVETKTKFGNIRVYLPNDMAAGDTISGTVLATPAGSTEKEQEKNLNTLEGYVVEVGGAKSNASNPAGKWILPVAASIIAIRILDHSGHCVTDQKVHLHIPMGTWTGPAQIPPVLQAGQPISIPGSFDGNATNTQVNFCGKPVKVLAESPRSVVIATDRENIGAGELTIANNGTTSSAASRNIALSMSIDKSALVRGDSTSIGLSVKGLSGLNEPILLHLATLSHGTVSMAGGNEQDVQIMPADVNSGEWMHKVLLTGTSAGSFTIAGTLSYPCPASR